MAPGITDTESRIQLVRYQELHAEAERQRLAATACVQMDRGGVMETMQQRVRVLMEQTRHLLQRVHTTEGAERAATLGTFAVSK